MYVQEAYALFGYRCLDIRINDPGNHWHKRRSGRIDRFSLACIQYNAHPLARRIH